MSDPLAQAPQSSDLICPNCGKPVPRDPWATWCDACDWNVLGTQPVPSEGRKARAESRAGERAHRLFADMQKESEEGRRRHNLARVGSYALAILTYVPCPALLALVAWLWVVVGLAPVTVVLSLLGVPLAYASRPRFGRIPRGVRVLSRLEAPTLHKLADNVSREMGTRAVSMLGIDASFGAKTSSIGIRRRRLIVIGLPLWDLLDPQERVALLGHEVGHDLGGDLSHRTIVSSSLRILATWYELLQPSRGPRSGYGSLLQSSEAIAEYLLLLLAPLVRAVFRLQRRLAVRASPLAEYRADEAAARVASTRAMAGCLDRLVLREKASPIVASALARGDPDLWANVAAAISGLPDREHERLRRAARLRHQSVDTTHPPTTFRIDLLRSRRLEPGVVLLSHSTAGQIQEELMDPRQRLLKSLAARSR